VDVRGGVAVGVPGANSWQAPIRSASTLSKRIFFMGLPFWDGCFFFENREQ